MSNRFLDLMFTPSVQAEQARHGSRSAYARVTRESGEPGMTARELAFIPARDSFYLATVSETGWPHLQHRGGPTGFVRFPGQARSPGRISPETGNMYRSAIRRSKPA